MDKKASLNHEEKAILLNGATEAPFSQTKFSHNDLKKGTFLCRLCGLALFRAESYFSSGCGWPSFDESLQNNVSQRPDKDGRRTEITCARCSGHLGHVFRGESFTPKNTRHCVNALSLDFAESFAVLDTEEGIFAGGCFWGVEALFKKLEGVVAVISGYCGGTINNPSYQDICTGKSGHYEAVRVLFDKAKLSYENLCQYFFEIHDFSQKNGQGPDIGSQYKSAIFYYNDEQKLRAEKTVKILQEKDFSVASKILPVSIFWRAEEEHQNYYERKQTEPYCHFHRKIF